MTQGFAEAFSRLKSAGLGPSRSRVLLTSTVELAPVRIPLDAPAPATTRIRVEFLTPTELKHEGSVIERPNFACLFRRACARITALGALYGEAPLEIDACSLCEEASRIALAEQELRHAGKQRRSSRTGQIHPLGGYLGHVTYEGPLDPFMPFLQAARWTGVGRQTVWGKGEITLTWDSDLSAPLTIAPELRSSAS